MAQQTWCVKSRELYEKEMAAWDILDKHEQEGTWNENLEFIEAEADRLHEENKTEYDNCFRTFKRDPGVHHTKDVIYSKEECIKWLEDNRDTIFYIDIERVKEFWDKYPNGVIYFG